MTTADDLERSLCQEWSTGLRLTTIPQAMDRLGIKESPGWRWRAARRLESSWRELLLSPEKERQISEVLGREFDEARAEQWRAQQQAWGLASILLTETEKLAARHILWRQRQAQGLPSPRETAAALGISVRETQDAFRMLGRLGFFTIPDGRRPSDYQLSEDCSSYTEGLGFSFHTVTLWHRSEQALDTGARFGVP